MALKMTHPTYGTRTVNDEQADAYLRVGWAEGAEVAPEVVDASVAEVLAQVGDDPQKAAVALAAETSRPHPRSTLVAALTRTAESTTTTSEV